MDPTRITAGIPLDHVHLTRLENAYLRVDVSPTTGGRITSIFHKTLAREFLWRNERLSLRQSAPGSAYDPVFYGGIDEVIPGDLPETIAGLECPDHGELWTLPLDSWSDGDSLVLEGRLPTWGLRYQKRITLRPAAPWMDLDYTIENLSSERRVFLWKLHAAVEIAPGDLIFTSAGTGVVADQAWSRWKTTAPFLWPVVDHTRADIIPPADGTTDFLFLYDLQAGYITQIKPAKHCQFTIHFDRQVFPYICYFASYGGFDGHYTAILEPCTAMPLSVNTAARLGQCSLLDGGQRIDTRVSIYAGPLVD